MQRMQIRRIPDLCLSPALSPHRVLHEPHQLPVRLHRLELREGLASRLRELRLHVVRRAEEDAHVCHFVQKDVEIEEIPNQMLCIEINGASIHPFYTALQRA